MSLICPPSPVATSTIVDGSTKGSISKGTASLLSHSDWCVQILVIAWPLLPDAVLLLRFIGSGFRATSFLLPFSDEDGSPWREVGEVASEGFVSRIFSLSWRTASRLLSLSPLVLLSGVISPSSWSNSFVAKWQIIKVPKKMGWVRTYMPSKQGA